MSETTKVTVTMSVETLEWLEANYRDATSQSMRVIQAITDARRLHELFDEETAVVIEGDVSEIIDDFDER